MKALLIASIAVVATLSTSCNTFIGMGRDLRLLGQSMEETAISTPQNSKQKKPEQTGGAPVY